MDPDSHIHICSLLHLHVLQYARLATPIYILPRPKLYFCWFSGRTPIFQLRNPFPYLQDRITETVQSLLSSLPLIVQPMLSIHKIFLRRSGDWQWRIRVLQNRSTSILAFLYSLSATLTGSLNVFEDTGHACEAHYSLFTSEPGVKKGSQHLIFMFKNNNSDKVLLLKPSLNTIWVRS